MADGTPTLDTIFGGSGTQPPGSTTPTLDTIFGPDPAKSAPVKSGPAFDAFFSQNPFGRVLNAFAQGPLQQWGADVPKIDPDTEKMLQKAGVFNDYKDGRTSILKSVNEALIRPALMAGDYVNPVNMAQRALNDAGAAIGGLESGVAQTGKEAQNIPYVGKALNLKEAGQTGAEMIEQITNTGIPELGIPHTPVDIPQARSLAVIGEGEGGYFGTKEPTPETDEQRVAATKEIIETQKAQGKEQGAPPQEGPNISPAPAQAQQVPDIHAIARQIAPATFQEYDALVTRQNTYRDWLTELGQQRTQAPEAQALQGQIETILGKVNGVEDRLTNAAADRLETARTNLDDFLRTDTGDMANVRSQLQKNDYRMRDIAPDVASAYREAQSRLPPPIEGAPAEAPAAVSEPVAAQEPQPEQQSAPQVVPSQEVAGTNPPLTTGQPLGRVPQNIAADVSQKLVSAGRPAEEADAAAAIVQAHYEARAERFGGKLGTAQEMYARDAPEIKGADVGGRKGLASGKTTIKNARSTITLFSKADASTFMHETGHHWLEELVNDAKDPNAPNMLHHDEAAVRNWLGVGMNEAIPTRAHEKFARGFERYLMEGRAPSQALASVFEKFKGWLTQIYQTVQKLRSPITDDIRDVFDRLVTKPTEKPVIADERPIEKTMADLHEEDAETTPPERAAEAADHVRSEIDQIAKEKAPDVYAELNPSGTVAGENQNPPSSGTQAGPIPGEGGTAAESGTLTAGRNETQTEGAERGRGGTARTEIPTGPNAIIPEPESDLVDKAGNIRLENLTDAEDIREVMRGTARANNDFLAARRGVLPVSEQLALAEAMGTDPKDLDFHKIGDAWNAEEILRGRKMLIQSATNVRDLAVKAARGSDAELLSYAEARARHVTIQRVISGVTAEAGRALAAFRKMNAMEGSKEAQNLSDFLQQETSRTLFQLKDEAAKVAGLDTPKQVSKFMYDSQKNGFGNMILEYWINGLISGPITHVTYVTGNTVLAAWNAIVETTAASGVGMARRALGGEGGVRLGEVPAKLLAAGKSIPKALSVAGESFRKDQQVELPGAKPTETPNLFGQPGTIAPEIPHGAYNWQDLGRDTFAAMHGASTAFIAGAKLALQGGEEGSKLIGAKDSGHAIPDIAVRGVNILPVGSAINLPSRFIKAIHGFFQTLNYSIENAAQAYRGATEEGLTGNKFGSRVSELLTNPSEKSMEASRQYANENTLMSRGGKLTQAISRVTNASFDVPLLGPFKPLKFIDPFVSIGSNIARQAILERTPLGIIDSQIRENLSGSNGAEAKDMQIAKMAVGTVLAGTWIGLASSGNLTGSGPSNPREQAALRLTGWQPDSIKVGDFYYDVHRLGPLGMHMVMAANLWDMQHQLNHETGSKLAADIAFSISKSILDETWFRGPADAIQAVQDPDRYGARYVQDQLSTFVPFSVGMSQISRMEDPYMREHRTFMDTLRDKVPGLSEGLLPRRDIWGEPIPNSQGIGGVTAIWQSRVNNDPVNQQLIELGFYPSQPQRKIRGVPLTDQQYDDYSRVAGRMAKMQLNAMVNIPGFGTLPAKVRHDMMSEAITTSRESARSLVMMQNPEIIEAATKAKAGLTQ